jgi:outer membrane protein
MNRIFFIIIILLIHFQLDAQTLRSEEAVEITLANNYGILLAKNATEIATNNTSKFNTGELPTFRLNSGTNYGLSGAEISYNSETIPNASTWVTQGVDFNAGVSANYLIYDFNGRKLYKEKLKEALNLAKLEERRSIEYSISGTLISYYNIAQIKENLMAQEQVLDISKERKERAIYQYKYGKNNKLAVLNAEVDINRDSIDYLNLKQQFSNEKRNLNLLLGRSVDTPFEIDTSLSFKKDLSLEQLLTEAFTKNIDLMLVQNEKQLSQLNIDINNTALKPQISANSSLGVFGGLNDSKVTIKNQFASDFGAGLSLSWNIFDGGFNKVRNKNLKVLLDNQDILENQLKEQITRDISNSWESYQNQLYIMQVETGNINTAELNFDRTSEQFKLGQISSVEFRQAQLNLLYAQINFNRAKLIAKINEIRLLQLSGNILEGM